MAADLTELPEYKEAQARYRMAKADAARNNDDVAAANVEREWADTRFSLYQKAVEQDGARQARELAIAEVKQKYPGVPEQIYASLTNPDEIRTVAESVHKDIEKQLEEQRQGWGSQTGGTDATPNSKKTPTQRMLDLRQRVLAGDKIANEEYRALELNQKLLNRFPWHPEFKPAPNERIA